MDTLPFRIAVDTHVHITWNEEPTLKTIRNVIRETIEHPQYRTGMPILCEYTQPDYNPTAEEIRAIAKHLSLSRSQLGPIALVVRSTLHYGLGNMLRAYCRMQGVRLSVFYDGEKALAWSWQEALTPETHYLQAGA